MNGSKKDGLRAFLGDDVTIVGIESIAKPYLIALIIIAVSNLPIREIKNNI